MCVAGRGVGDLRVRCGEELHGRGSREAGHLRGDGGRGVGRLQGRGGRAEWRLRRERTEVVAEQLIDGLPESLLDDAVLNLLQGEEHTLFAKETLFNGAALRPVQVQGSIHWYLAC
jgi:hypothetical protein